MAICAQGGHERSGAVSPQHCARLLERMTYSEYRCAWLNSAYLVIERREITEKYGARQQHLKRTGFRRMHKHDWVGVVQGTTHGEQDFSRIEGAHREHDDYEFSARQPLLGRYNIRDKLERAIEVRKQRFCEGQACLAAHQDGRTLLNIVEVDLSRSSLHGLNLFGA
eukprot:7302928-Prymnesium_polylepis.2